MRAKHEEAYFQHEMERFSPEKAKDLETALFVSYLCNVFRKARERLARSRTAACKKREARLQEEGKITTKSLNFKL